MLLFVLPSLFILVHSTPSPILRTPTVSEAPQIGRYFVSSAPRPTNVNDAQLRKVNYLDIISPRLFLNSFRATGGNQGPATSPYNSPADYFAQRRAYSTYAADVPVAAAAPTASSLYAPPPMTAPVSTVITYASAPPSYQQNLSAPALPTLPAPAAVAAVPTITYAAQPNQSAMYNVVSQPQPVAAAASPIASYAPASTAAPAVAAAPPVPSPINIRPAPVAAAPVAAPVSQVYYQPAAPAPVYAAPPTPTAQAYSQPFYAPRAMTVPLPTVTVAAPPTVIPSAPPASMPVFDFISAAQPRSSIYPSNIIVPPAPVSAAPVTRPIYSTPPLLQPSPVPSSPVYIQGDSSSLVKNPFQISYLPQSSAQVQTVQPTVSTASAAVPSTMMTVTLSRPSLSYLQIQNGQHGRK